MTPKYTKEQAMYLAQDSISIIREIIARIVPDSNLPANWKELIINHVNRALWILRNYRSEVKIEQSNDFGIESFTLSRTGYGEDGLSIEYAKDSRSDDIRKLHYYISKNMSSALLTITVEDGCGSLIFRDKETEETFYCYLSGNF